MDEYVGKKAAGGHGFSSKGSNIVFRDQNREDRSIQYCSRLGCSTRLNSMKGTQIGDLGNVKYVKATFRSTSSKIVAGNSSKSLSSKQTLQREKAIAESSNSRGNTEDSECNNTQHFIEELHLKSQQIEDAEFLKSNPTKVGIQTLLPASEELELPILERVSTKSSESSVSCTNASSSKSHVQVNHHLGSGNQPVSLRSFFRHSTYASRKSGNVASPGTQGLGTGVHWCSGLKSLIYSTVSAVLPSSRSSSNFSRNRRIDAVGKGPSGGENSAPNGKGTIGPSTGRHSGSTPTGISGSSRSLPEHLMRQQTLLPIRNQPSTRDDAVSVRTCRASTGDARTRLSEQGVGNVVPVHEPIVIAHPQQNQVSILDAVPESSSRSSSIELPGVGNVLPVHEPIVITHPQQNQVSISEAIPESSSRSSSIELPGVGNIVPVHEPIVIAHPQQNRVSIAEAVPESSSRSSLIEVPVVGNVIPVHEPIVITHLQQNQVSISEAVPESSTRSSSTELAGVGNVLPVHEPLVIAPPQQNQVSIPEAVPESSSQSSPIELPLVLLNSSGRPGSSSRAARNRMVSHPEDSSTHTLHDSLGDRDGYRCSNLDRIEEVFLALERIKRAAERLSMPDADLLSGGPRFHDQHRGMRMNIDNMSYEELLALEEQMGTVSTGLSKDQLSECLKRSIYTTDSEVSRITGSGDDAKCSICLEEYVSGDEVGKLACEHHYHEACIHQWLGQKNWCPVCKAWAIPS